MVTKEGEDHIIEEPGIEEPAESTPEINPIDVIISYVMTTPGNTNPAILKQLVEKAISNSKDSEKKEVAVKVFNEERNSSRQIVGDNIELNDIDIGEETEPTVSVKGKDDDEDILFENESNLDGTLNVRFIMPNKDVVVDIEHPVEGNNKETK